MLLFLTVLEYNCLETRIADKGGAIVIQNRMNYKEVYQQLNNQKLYRQLPAYSTKEHTRELNRPIKTFDLVLQSTLRTFIPYAILQLIRFIFDHNVFTFDNQFFIQTHGTAVRTRFALQYANIFMHKRQTRDMTDKVPFVVQHFSRVEKLHHVLRGLQHIIDD
eukprot:g42749.t1